MNYKVRTSLSRNWSFSSQGEIVCLALSPLDAVDKLLQILPTSFEVASRDNIGTKDNPCIRFALADSKSNDQIFVYVEAEKK